MMGRDTRRVDLMGAGRAAVLVGLVLAMATSAGAQTVFSLRNVGQPLATEDARMIARGGWGMAIADSMHPGFKNLASLAAIKHVALSFTGYGERTDNSDQRGDRKDRVDQDCRALRSSRFCRPAGKRHPRSQRDLVPGDR